MATRVFANITLAELITRYENNVQMSLRKVDKWRPEMDKKWVLPTLEVIGGDKGQENERSQRWENVEPPKINRRISDKPKKLTNLEEEKVE